MFMEKEENGDILILKKVKFKKAGEI